MCEVIDSNMHFKTERERDYFQKLYRSIPKKNKIVSFKFVHSFPKKIKNSIHS